MAGVARNFLTAVLGRYGARLRFPHLLLGLAVLFVVDLVVPDLLPFVDELLLGLATLLVGSLTHRRLPPPEGGQMKDVTPDDRRHRDAPRSDPHRH